MSHFTSVEPQTKLMRTMRLSTGGRIIYTWCPGCNCLHPFRIRDEDGNRPREGSVWDWDGNVESPTFSPSLLVYSTVHHCGKNVVHYKLCADTSCYVRLGHYVSPEGPAHIEFCENRGNCHSFLRAGQWEFLADSAHELAGKTVPMVELPESWFK